MLEEFEAERPRLLRVAYRLVGSTADAEDIVQEAWLRLQLADADQIRSIPAWLTTVVARLGLDLLRSKGSRREVLMDDPEPVEQAPDPAVEAALLDEVSQALLLVLDRLAPAERLAFVMHDVFEVPFDQIADVLDRSPAAARQLASRGRRRLHGAEPVNEPSHQARSVIAAFLAAAHQGDLDGLAAVLAPDVVLRADQATVAIGAQPRLGGAEAVIGQLNAWGAKAAMAATVDGYPALVWLHRGQARVVFELVVSHGRIVEIGLVSNPTELADRTIEVNGRRLQ